MTRTPALLRRRGTTPVLDPDGRAADGPVLVLRPRRVLVAAWVGAVATVVAFGIVAVLLRTSDTGVYFRLADQVAMALLGVLIAAGVLLLARPRVRADARGIEVRNVGVPRYLPWELVRAVAFPDGASWARVDLPDDEYLAVMAVQAVDGQRAVVGIRKLRALHAAARGAARSAAPQDGAPQGWEPQDPEPQGPEPDRP
jgi:hypothetical protein